jgi:hypothetical protein
MIQELIIQLVSNHISFKQLVLIYCIFINDKHLYDLHNRLDRITKEEILFLEDNDLITIVYPDNTDLIYYSNISLTNKGVSLISNLLQEEIKETNSFDLFLNKWYELWPKGIKTGGYYVKTDKNGCGKNLKKFIKNNPSITKEEILAGTQRYIESMKERNYDKMKLAPYFIYKDGISTLEGYCNSENNTNNYEKDDPFKLNV